MTNCKQSSHPQDRHCHKTKDVGEDELLVDGQVEPGVVGEKGGVLALSGEEEGKDAHNRCHASDIVWGLSFCNKHEVKIVQQKVILGFP